MSTPRYLQHDWDAPTTPFLDPPRPPAHRADSRHDPLYVDTIVWSNRLGVSVENRLEAWEPAQLDEITQSDDPFVICWPECMRSHPLDPERLASAIAEVGLALFGYNSRLVITVGRGTPPPPTVIVHGPIPQLRALASHAISSNRVCFFALEHNAEPFYELIGSITPSDDRTPQAIRNIVRRAILTSPSIAAFTKDNADLIVYDINDPTLDEDTDRNLLSYVAASVSLSPRIPAILDEPPSFNICCNFPVIGDEDQTTFRELIVHVTNLNIVPPSRCTICEVTNHASAVCILPTHPDWLGYRPQHDSPPSTSTPQ